MSGNPFRRAQQPPPLVVPASGTRFPPPPEDASPRETDRRPSKATKRVRIATPPPLSPDPETPLAAEIDADPIHQVAHESHTGSPPPVLQSDGVSEYNPFDRHFNELAQVQSSEVLENTRRNSGSGEANPALPSPEVVRGVPENPFARTLATMEPTQAGKLADESTKGRNDGTMDVDDFAKMLLTGKGPQSQSSPTSMPASAVAVATAASTSSTGQSASSQDKTEIPSSDQDSSSSGAESEDVSKPTSKTYTAPAVKQKPAPPKHRHGKSVAERTPQTVSFADFDSLPASGGGGTAAASAAVASGATASPRPSSKALPQIPPAGRKVTATAGESKSKSKPLPSAEGSGSVPAESDSAKEQPQTTSGSKSDFTSTAVPKTAKAPPPPPTRRVGNRSSVYDAHATPLANPEALSSPLHGDEHEGRPRRAMAEAMQQSQISSSRSSSRSGRVNMPPPPPPRRRGSSKGSVDLHHQSGQETTKLSRTSQDSIRRASGQSDVHDATGSRTAVDSLQEKEDVLANLDALQAEVDALRLRYGQSN